MIFLPHYKLESVFTNGAPSIEPNNGNRYGSVEPGNLGSKYSPNLYHLSDVRVVVTKCSVHIDKYSGRCDTY